MHDASLSGLDVISNLNFPLIKLMTENGNKTANIITYNVPEIHGSSGH